MVILLNNTVIGVHPLVGKITNLDIINDIDLIISDYNTLVRFINEIIDLDNDDSELVDFILDNDIGNHLANISYILKSFL